MDRDVGLELDFRLDPGRRRIDDRDPGEHVRAVDPIAKPRGRVSQLHPCVDPLDLERVRRDVDCDRSPLETSMPSVSVT